MLPLPSLGSNLLLEELLVNLYLDSHVARADFFAERRGEPVGCALVRVVEADFHGGVEPLDFVLDDICVGALLRAARIVENPDVGAADFAV